MSPSSLSPSSPDCACAGLGVLSLLFHKKKNNQDIPGVPSRRTLASQPELEWLCLQCNLTKELINKQSTSTYLAILILQAGGTAEERARLSCSDGGDGDAEDCSGRGVVSFRCSGQDPGCHLRINNIV